MTHDIDIARIAALVGEPARAAMLLALGDGRALPAGELAACAGVSAATASGHLAAMREAGLLDAKQQGRHRYYRLASAQVAALLESLMLVAAQNPARVSSHVDPLLQAGRTCYSHLAGRLGVSICDGLLARGALHIEDDLAHFTPRGLALLDDFGLDTRALRRQPVSKTCIDWSERRHHLSGPVGVAWYRRCVELGWVRHHLDSRAVSVTKAGAKGLAASFGSAFTATI
ncbi:ArsR/SmtB family transcription factor [Metallibacterium scheffleri]|uniref:Transcriptional regulator n=1 Tax=Metallibacterium scheffleri TaxID=993689 RepID=A0A4S3KNR4_9GAMM|nr:helix-turn-helix transcriptional regulator [Metallibacterium scheffleri]THD10607.1 transcriptional regulator [Metallibacterium scheffleri]